MIFLFPFFYLCSTQSIFPVLLTFLQAMIRSQLHLFLHFLLVSIRKNRTTLEIRLTCEFYLFEVRIIDQDNLFFSYFWHIRQTTCVKVWLSNGFPMILDSFGNSFVSLFLCYVDVVWSKGLYPVHDYFTILAILVNLLVVSLVFLWLSILSLLPSFYFVRTLIFSLDFLSW